MAMLKILGLFLLLGLVDKLVLCQNSTGYEDHIYAKEYNPDTSTVSVSSDNELTHVRTKNLSGNVKLTTLEVLPTIPPLDQEPSSENKQNAVQTVTENQSQVFLLSTLGTKAPTDGGESMVVFNGTSGTLPTTEKPITVTLSNLDQIQEDSTTPMVTIYAEKNAESSTEFGANLTQSADSENSTEKRNQTDVVVSTSTTTGKGEEGAAFSGDVGENLAFDFGYTASSFDKESLSTEGVNSVTDDMLSAAVDSDYSMLTQDVTEDYRFEEITNKNFDTTTLSAVTSALNESVENVADVASFIHVDEVLLSTVSQNIDEVTTSDENIEDVSLILNDDDYVDMDLRFDFGFTKSSTEEQFSGFSTNSDNSKIENEENGDSFDNSTDIYQDHENSTTTTTQFFKDVAISIASRMFNGDPKPTKTNGETKTDEELTMTINLNREFEGFVSANTTTDVSTATDITTEDTPKDKLTVAASTESFSTLLPNYATTEESTETFNDLTKNSFGTTVTNGYGRTSTTPVTQKSEEQFSSANSPISISKDLTALNRNITQELTTPSEPKTPTEEFETTTEIPKNNFLLTETTLSEPTTTEMPETTDPEYSDEDESEEDYVEGGINAYVEAFFGLVESDQAPVEWTDGKPVITNEEASSAGDDYDDEVKNDSEEDVSNTTVKINKNKNDEYLLANLKGRNLYFRVRIVYNETSFFIPSDADIEAHSPNTLNISWQSSTPNKNNSLEINLGHSLELNIVKGTQTHIYEKSLSLESENKLDVDTTEVTLDDGIRIYFTNIKVSKRNHGNQTALRAGALPSITKQIQIFVAKIIGGCVAVFVVIGISIFLLIKKFGGTTRSFKPNEVRKNV